jgi:hypothetical protein
MSIQEVFHFENGSTIFSGEVVEGPEEISTGMYDLSVDGQSVGAIKIDCERSRGRVPNIRSIEISQELPFDGDRLKGCEAYFAVLEHA